MYSIVIYDTSDYVSFPIGGQITSIRNFLRYVSEQRGELVKKILLVGVSTHREQVRRISPVRIGESEFDFLPVVWREDDLGHVRKSLRIAFLKGLFLLGGRIRCEKHAVHFLHTPEAFLYVKCRHPWGNTAVFSHGSFFNMTSGFRFYRGNGLIAFCFDRFLIWMLKKADLVFTLDQDSTWRYMRYNPNVCKVENSIVLPEDAGSPRKLHAPVRLLFVGRLSKIKRVDEIIRFVDAQPDCVELTIVGDGEERATLQEMTAAMSCAGRVTFTGAVKPEEVGDRMRMSDILVMNSSLEGKPMTVMEAQSYGMPVITTPVGGVPELAENHQSGEFTDGSAASMARALDAITRDYGAYSRRALEKAKQFDYRLVNARICDRLLDV